MEKSQIELEVKDGVRFVLGYQSKDKQVFYLTNLLKDEAEAHRSALSLIKDKPSISERLDILKVRPVNSAVGFDNAVMLLAKDPRFSCFERVFENKGHAYSVVGRTLKDEVEIFTFSTEVVKSYNENRA
jgi:hypothetical protein